MNDAALYSQWYFWLIIATALILAAALLLILVIVQARKILKHAVRALHAVSEIKENTMPIWDLQDTNAVALDILEGAKSIKAHTGLVAQNLPKNINT